MQILRMDVIIVEHNA